MGYTSEHAQNELSKASGPGDKNKLKKKKLKKRKQDAQDELKMSRSKLNMELHKKVSKNGKPIYDSSKGGMLK